MNRKLRLGSFLFCFVLCCAVCGVPASDRRPMIKIQITGLFCKRALSQSLPARDRRPSSGLAWDWCREVVVVVLQIVLQQMCDEKRDVSSWRMTCVCEFVAHVFDWCREVVLQIVLRQMCDETRCEFVAHDVCL